MELRIKTQDELNAERVTLEIEMTREEVLTNYGHFTFYTDDQASPLTKPLREKIQELQGQAQAFDTDRHTERNRADELQSRNTELRVKMTQLTQDLALAETRADQSAHALSASNTTNIELHKINQALTRELDEAKRAYLEERQPLGGDPRWIEIVERAGKVPALEQQIQELRAERRNLISERSLAQGELESAREENRELAKKLTDAEQERDKAMSALTMAQTSREHNRAKAKKEFERAETLAGELAMYKDREQGLTKQLQAGAQVRYKLAGELAAEQDNAEHYRRRMEAFQRGEKGLVKQLQAGAQVRDALIAKNEKLTAELADALTQIGLIRHQGQQLREALDKLAPVGE